MDSQIHMGSKEAIDMIKVLETHTISEPATLMINNLHLKGVTEGGTSTEMVRLPSIIAE